MFAAASNDFSYRVLNTPPFSIKSMVASMYCALVTPIPLFWCWCVNLTLSAVRDPAISECFACHLSRSQSGSPQGICLSDYCSGKLAVMPTPASKRGMRANTRRYALECADMKTSAMFERGRDYRSSRTRWYSEHSPNVGRVYALRKCLVRAMSLKTREEGPQLWNQRCGNIGIHSTGWHAVWYCSRKSNHRRIGVPANSLSKGRVEVVQLNCCYTTIDWKYPFLTGPERKLQSDYFV